MEIKRRGLPTRLLAPSTGLRASLSAYSDDRYVRGMLEYVCQTKSDPLDNRKVTHLGLCEAGVIIEK